MIKKGTLSNGFKYEIDDEIMDDMEMVEAVAEAQGENPLAVATVIKMALGEDQKKRLYDYIRNDKGRVPVQKAVESLTEMFEALGEDGKN